MARCSPPRACAWARPHEPRAKQVPRQRVGDMIPGDARGARRPGAHRSARAVVGQALHGGGELRRRLADDPVDAVLNELAGRRSRRRDVQLAVRIASPR